MHPTLIIKHSARQVSVSQVNNSQLSRCVYTSPILLPFSRRLQFHQNVGRRLACVNNLSPIMPVSVLCRNRKRTNPAVIHFHDTKLVNQPIKSLHRQSATKMADIYKIAKKEELKNLIKLVDTRKFIAALAEHEFVWNHASPEHFSKAKEQWEASLARLFTSTGLHQFEYYYHEKPIIIIVCITKVFIFMGQQANHMPCLVKVAIYQQHRLLYTTKYMSTYHGDTSTYLLLTAAILFLQELPTYLHSEQLLILPKCMGT